MKKYFAIIVLLLFLTSCIPAATPASVAPIPQTAIPVQSTNTPQPTQPWWREAVFYEIFVRSFYDSNGDGIGDLNGVTQRLDYLQSLGVTAIWLMPIQPSPSYHGYDVVDYYAVNPEYGTMDDLSNLLQEAHSRDIRVIMDLVINHTSSQHPWFVAANSNAGSPYHNWYVWSDASGGNKWYQGNPGYYYAYFWEGMPDLNFTNPAVTEEVENISRFWLHEVGMDGFRIDAAKHLIEKGAVLENTAETRDWFTAYLQFTKTLAPQAYVVGEVAGAGGLLAESYSDGLDQVFNFELANAIVNSVAGGAKSSVESGYKFVLKEKPDGNYATFLTNHDQNRVNSVLKENDDKARVAAVLLFTAPGTPFIYYGEEIGMLGAKPDEDIRLPMQWTDNPANAGFTTVTPWRAPHPSTINRNVQTQQKDPASLLNQYRVLSSLRREYKSLQTGSVHLLQTANPYVFAMLRVLGEEKMLVVVNLSNQAQPQVEFKGEADFADDTYIPQILYGQQQVLAPLTIQKNAISPYIPSAELPPYATILAILK